MKKSLIPFLLAMTFGACSTAKAGMIISNDNFVNARVYSGSSQAANNSAATAEPGETYAMPVGGGAPTHSLWWKYTPLLSGQYQINTIGSDFDTVLAAYTGTKVSALTRVAFDDDSGGSNTSLLNVFLTKGVTYLIQVDGYNGGKGNVDLQIKLKRYYSPITYITRMAGIQTDVNSGGLLTITVATTGLVSGKFQLGAKTYPFTAAVDDTGVFVASFVRPGLLPVKITATFVSSGFNLSDGVPATVNSGSCSCALVVGGNSFTSLAMPVAPGDPALVGTFPACAPYTAVANPCPRAGTYHFTINSLGLTGWTVASFTVSPLGKVTGAGNLGDGTPFTFSSPVLDNTGGGVTGIGTGGSIAFHVPLYLSAGRLTVGADFDATSSPVSLSGQAAWIRPSPKPGTVLYPTGVANFYGVLGSRYVAPSTGLRIDPIFNAKVGACTFTAAPFGYPSVSQGVVLSPANLFTYNAPNTNLVTLKVNTTAGSLSGSTKPTGAPAASAINATFLNTTSLKGFYGYLPGLVQYGPVTVLPNP